MTASDMFGRLKQKRERKYTSERPEAIKRRANATQFVGVSYSPQKNDYVARYKGKIVGRAASPQVASDFIVRIKLAEVKDKPLKGVTWNATMQKWRVYVTRKKVGHYLGHYDTLEEANKAAIAFDNKQDNWVARRQAYDAENAAGGNGGSSDD